MFPKLLHSVRVIGAILKAAGKGWFEHNVSRMAAAIAYYGIFSLAPLLIVAVSLAGLLFGKDAAEGLVVGRLTSVVGAENAGFVQSMLAKAYESRGGALATVIALLLLAWTATRIIGATRSALNEIWGVQAKGGPGFVGYVLSKLMDLGMVVGVGIMFLASMLANAAVSIITRSVASARPLPNWTLHGIGVVFSLAVVTCFVAIIFRVLPNVTMRWSRLFAGASLTAVFFTLGNFLIGRYLGRVTTESVFGAAGSLAALMIWIYYSTQIILFGAEITRAYGGLSDEPSSRVRGAG